MAALAFAGPAAAGNPITVNLSLLSQSTSFSGQDCINVGITDSVTNQPLPADVELVITGTMAPPTVINGVFSFGNASVTLEAKTDYTGHGTLCFTSPSGSSASVSLYPNGGILVYGSPNYPTTGTSNTLRVNWGPYPGNSELVLSSTVTASTAQAGQTSIVDITVTNDGSTTALAPTFEADFSSPSFSVISATSDGGTCVTGQPVTCPLADIPSGGQGHLELTLKATVAGPETLSLSSAWAWLSGQNRFRGDSIGTVALTAAAAPPAADVLVRFQPHPAVSRIGAPSRLVLSLVNLGPQGAAGETVVFAVPAGVKVAALSSTKAQCSVATRSCVVSGLRAAHSLVIGLSVVPAAAGRLPVKVTASRGTVADPVTSNNTTTLVLLVRSAA